MKKSKITFLIAELFLVVIAGFFIHQIFRENVPQKRVAVILSNSGDKRWDGLINGLKQSANVNDVHLIICNTDDIESAQDEKELIDEQLENDVDAFIICPAPGEDTSDMLGQLDDVKAGDMIYAVEVPLNAEIGSMNIRKSISIVVTENE